MCGTKVVTPTLSIYNVLVPFTVRDHKPEEFETLWRLDQQCFPPGISYSRMELKAYMHKRGSFTLVAIDADGTIAGFIVAHAGKTGHGAKVVALSRGTAECLRVPRETLDFLKEQRIEAHILPTTEAAELYNGGS